MYISPGRTVDQFAGEDVYVIGCEDNTNSWDLVQVFTDIDEAQKVIDDMTNAERRDNLLLYGKLEAVDVLPSNLLNNNTFLIILEKDDDYGIVVEVNSITSEDLAGHIQNYLDPSPTDAIQPTIEDIFVLYGMELGLDGKGKIDHDDIDEEAMDSCGKLTAEIENIRSYLDKI